MSLTNTGPVDSAGSSFLPKNPTSSMRGTKNLVAESILQVFSGFKSVLKLRYRKLSATISPMHFLSLQVISRKTDCLQ
jgi:hypothetical protein